MAERVGLLAAGDGRSSSASLRTAAAAPRRPKIAPRFLSNQWVRPHTLLRKYKKPQDGAFYIYRWRRGWDCSRPGTAARPPLRSGPPQLRRDVQKSLRDFCRTSGFVHTPCSVNIKSPRTGLSIFTDGGEGGIARGRGRPLVLRFAPDRRSCAATSKNRSAIFVEPVGSSTHPAP